jgi:hypothetical protein
MIPTHSRRRKQNKHVYFARDVWGWRRSEAKNDTRVRHDNERKANIVQHALNRPLPYTRGCFNTLNIPRLRLSHVKDLSRCWAYREWCRRRWRMSRITTGQCFELTVKWCRWRWRMSRIITIGQCWASYEWYRWRCSQKVKSVNSHYLQLLVTVKSNMHEN